MKVPDSPQGVKSAMQSTAPTSSSTASHRVAADGAARDRVSSDLGALLGGTAQARHASRLDEVRRAMQAGHYRVDPHAIADALGCENFFAARLSLSPAS
jgi:hypothetical protein